MKVLLTGATGYIGKRILPLLVDKGMKVVCGVRDKSRFNPPAGLSERISVIELDLLNEDQLQNIPADIDAAYYLVHSMSSSTDYQSLERNSAVNFRKRL